MVPLSCGRHLAHNSFEVILFTFKFIHNSFLYVEVAGNGCAIFQIGQPRSIATTTYKPHRIIFGDFSSIINLSDEKRITKSHDKSHT